jgi:predicted SAM-dependent methyltransferase
LESEQTCFPDRIERRRPEFLKTNQKEFNKNALLTSLALCFKDAERSLSVEQIASREFTPYERYSKMWINELLLAGAINCRAVASVSVVADATSQQCIFVSRPGSASLPLHQFIAENVRDLKQQMKSDNDCSNYLERLNLDLMACECIQYVNYFALRDDLIVINSSPNELHLHLLLQENMRDQVFMLLWRAIKKHVEILGSKKEVLFSDLVQKAFEYNSIYHEKGLTIDSYPWPKQLGTSKLAYIVRLLKKI